MYNIYVALSLLHPVHIQHHTQDMSSSRAKNIFGSISVHERACPKPIERKAFLLYSYYPCALHASLHIIEF